MRSMILGLALSFAVTAPALADDKADKAKAKQLYDDGLSHYNIAEYTEAITSWKQAYKLSKKPLLLFNIGQAYRLSGDCNGATTFYDSYQREEPSPKNQAELDQAITLCKDKGTKPVDKTPDKPIEKPADQAPDKPVVRVDKTPDRPAVKSKEPEGRVADTGPSHESDENETRDRGDAQPGKTKKLAGIGVGAVGIVLEGVAIYFALDSKNQSDALNGYTGEWTQTQTDIESKGKSDTKNAFVLGGVGAAAIIAGGVLYYLGASAHATESSVAVVPTHGGAAVAYGFRF